MAHSQPSSRGHEGVPASARADTASAYDLAPQPQTCSGDDSASSLKPESLTVNNNGDSAATSPTVFPLPPSCTPDFPPPPDGGVTAWCQVAAGFLVNGVGWGFPAMFGVYQLYYVTELGLPGTQVAWIGSTQTFLAYLFCVVSGRLADSGHVVTTAAAGAALAVVGTLMTSFAREYWQLFLAQGVCTGLGLGLVTTPAMSVIHSYFSEKRSVAIATSTVGTSFGSMVLPAVVQNLIPQIGFAWAVRASALVAFIICGCALLLLRPLRTVRKTHPLIDVQALREPPYMLFALSSFLFFMAMYFAFFYMNLVAQDVAGMPPTASVQLLIINSAVGIPARPLAGFVADRWLGSLETFVLCAAASGAALFGWIGARTPAGMFAYASTFGIANGAGQGIWAAAIVSLTPDPSRFGIRYGMMSALSGFASLAGPPAAAAIVEAGMRAGAGYVPAQAWAGATTIAGALCALVAAVLIRRSGPEPLGGGGRGNGEKNSENVPV